MARVGMMDVGVRDEGVVGVAGSFSLGSVEGGVGGIKLVEKGAEGPPVAKKQRLEDGRTLGQESG